MKKRKKTQKNYYCKKCDFTSRNKTDFNRHLSTTKHKMVINGNSNGNTKANFVDFSCDICGKVYKYKSGLSRHRKGCVETNHSLVLKSTVSKNATASMKDINQEMIDKLTNTIQKQGDLIEKLIDHQKEIIPKIGNNNNNKISINVFLNEHCKNAMNLTDFVENIKVSLEDLEYTNQHGYAKGISNIFTKHLTHMKPTERPIHCCDKKRLQFYIKEDDQWEKDETNVKINKSIADISVKQIKKLKEWEEQNPTYLEDEKLLEKWHSLLTEIMGPVAGDAGDKNKEQIKDAQSLKENN